MMTSEDGKTALTAMRGTCKKEVGSGGTRNTQVIRFND